MALVTFTVRTWGLQPFPASERLVARFVPSSAGHTALSVFPQREVTITPGVDGFASIDLAPTEGLSVDAWYDVIFDWFNPADPVTGAPAGVEWSEAKGQLRVPASGGVLGDLLSAPPPPASIVADRGRPGDHIQNVIYIDNTGMTAGLWLPAESVRTS